MRLFISENLKLYTAQRPRTLHKPEPSDTLSQGYLLELVGAVYEALKRSELHSSYMTT